jgi:putative FmdB family regulatory protein
MPTYEYICEKCGNEFEAVQSISAAALKTCPADLCKQKKWGRGPVKRKISAGGGLLFKGSGFYITDYRSENYKQAEKSASHEPKGTAKAEPAPAAKTEPKPAAKTETKPAAKPAAKPGKK